MPDNPTPDCATPDTAWLEALTRAGPAQAVIAGSGAAATVAWCSSRFARLFEAAPRPGQPLAVLLGQDAVERLQCGAVVAWATPADGRWQLTLTGTDVGAAVLVAVSLAEPPADEQQHEERARRLQERLDLVQDFGRIGVFERDPVTMQGEWDRHMYRIWGLPPAPPGSPSPTYAQTMAMQVSQDQRETAIRESLAHPGLHSQRIRIRRPDGQLRHLHTQWRISHDARGRPQRLMGINTDDTEAFELAHQADRLRAELDVALELGRIALWRLELDSGRLVLDERGCDVIGMTCGESGIDRNEARARIHPDDLAGIRTAADFTRRTGEPSDMELRWRCPSGDWKHLLLRCALQSEVDGRPLGFVGVLLDVTERVQEARRTLDIARRLEAAAEAARIGLWSSEVGSALPSWNRRMYELFGLDPGASPLPLEAWLERCVHPDDRQSLQAQVLDWWRRGEGGFEIEFRIVRPSDGVQRWLLVRGDLDRDDSRQARRAEGVAMDITQQHETLRQLRETVERLTLTASALGLGTWETDLRSGRIHWDAQMFRLRGIESPGRVIATDEVAGCLHPEERPRVMADQFQSLRERQPWRREFRVLWPDGTVRWVTSHSVPMFDELGLEVRRIGVNWDSTDAHSAAQAVREREVAVAESQAKSQAMSRISHELRTPLNAMLGFTQLLRSDEVDADPEQRARWLGHVEEAGRHLLALIDDVLELSRAQVTEVRVVRQPVAWAAFVDTTLPLVAADAELRQVELRRGALPGVVAADPVRLRQVLLNLMSNAIKYNRPGGWVELSSEVVGAEVRLDVADSGIGIAPQALRHAFEPFNRLGAESSGVAGSGLGLAVVKALVEHMDGRVEAHSQPGQGSRFSVTLPAAAEEACIPDAAPPAAPLPVAPQADCQAPARVLYIEDNPVNALLVSELFSRRPGVRLEVAKDGRSGVRRAIEQVPHLVLVDMQLPDIDGLAVLRALRADPATADVCCVALSANANPADRQAALAAGFADYWTKPFDFGRFLAAVGALVGRTI